MYVQAHEEVDRVLAGKEQPGIADYQVGAANYNYAGFQQHVP